MCPRVLLVFCCFFGKSFAGQQQKEKRQRLRYVHFFALLFVFFYILPTCCALRADIYPSCYRVCYPTVFSCCLCRRLGRWP